MASPVLEAQPEEAPAAQPGAEQDRMWELEAEQVTREGHCTVGTMRHDENNASIAGGEQVAMGKGSQGASSQSESQAPIREQTNVMWKQAAQG